MTEFNTKVEAPVCVEKTTLARALFFLHFFADKEELMRFIETHQKGTNGGVKK